MTRSPRSCSPPPPREELRALLMGEKQSEALKLDNETLSLDVAASDLLTLQALNAARLKELALSMPPSLATSLTIRR